MHVNDLCHGALGTYSQYDERSPALITCRADTISRIRLILVPACVGSIAVSSGIAAVRGRPLRHENTDL